MKVAGSSVTISCEIIGSIPKTAELYWKLQYPNSTVMVIYAGGKINPHTSRMFLLDDESGSIIINEVFDVICWTVHVFRSRHPRYLRRNRTDSTKVVVSIDVLTLY